MLEVIKGFELDKRKITSDINDVRDYNYKILYMGEDDMLRNVNYWLEKLDNDGSQGATATFKNVNRIIEIFQEIYDKHKNAEKFDEKKLLPKLIVQFSEFAKKLQ